MCTVKPWFRVKIELFSRILVFYFNMEPRLTEWYRVNSNTTVRHQRHTYRSFSARSHGNVVRSSPVISRGEVSPVQRACSQPESEKSGKVSEMGS